MMNSSSCPDSSKAIIPPNRAPVSARALSMTSCSTVSGSRLSLTRRLASLNRVSRSLRSVHLPPVLVGFLHLPSISLPVPDCGRPWAREYHKYQLYRIVQTLTIRHGYWG